ncbi:MAG: FAD-binding protein [Peptococcaceae bacterium]|nr:FAD-binding protein [Peptococcaceae bacterium]
MEVKIRKEPIQADVLIIGGGVAGMQAAIAAGEKGANVVVVEKANTRHSGCSACGTDHFMCYIPECHGDDVNQILQEIMESLLGPNQDMDIFVKMIKRSYELIQKWESYGINMRPTGKWNFEGHTMPGRRNFHLKYDGHNQKELLTKKARQVGAKVINHTTITELLVKDGKVVGAIGINSQKDQPEMVIFQTKSAIITTGGASRLYPNLNPAFPFDMALCPSNGAGAAIAYRAGAKLVNLDIPYVHAGPTIFQRGGKGTWIGLLTDINGKPVGPFMTKPSREYGDVTSDIWQGVFSEKIADGTGPVYMNCSALSDEDLDYQRTAFVSEGCTSINEYFDQYGIDLHKQMVEFSTYECDYAACGPEINADTETSLPGLYAAGDLVGNVCGRITGAAVLGQISGENAADYSKELEFTAIDDMPIIKEKYEWYNAVMNREIGAGWLEVNSTLSQIMDKYLSVKSVRSESLMRAGYKYLGDLKKYATEQLKAENAHELMRTLEVMDLMDLSQAIFLCSENRKETRGFHRRSDYTFTNPLLNNRFQTICLEDGKPVLEFRDKVKKY